MLRFCWFKSIHRVRHFGKMTVFVKGAWSGGFEESVDNSFNFGKGCLMEKGNGENTSIPWSEHDMSVPSQSTDKWANMNFFLDA